MSKLFRVAIVAAVCAALGAGPVPGQDSGGDSPAAPEPTKGVWQKMFGGSAPPEATAGTEQPEGGLEASYRYSSKVLRTQAKLHKTRAVAIPEVRDYIGLVDARQAGPDDLERFSHLLAQRGFLEIALVYSEEALRLDPDNAEYWTNHATIARYMGDHSEAIDSYRKAIEIDPGLAFAHYNLGVSYDAKGKYDQAIEEYVKALTIDPSLSNVAVNPQVVNNFTSYAAASLLLYQRRGGNQTLPLIPVGEIDPGELTIQDDTSD